MGRSIVRANVPSSVSTSDDMVSRQRVVFRSVITADPARLLLAQHSLTNAAMLGTEATLIR
jgi:hypothetical protein